LVRHVLALPIPSLNRLEFLYVEEAADVADYLALLPSDLTLDFIGVLLSPLPQKRAKNNQKSAELAIETLLGLNLT